jgi:hypothetical protein
LAQKHRRYIVVGSADDIPVFASEKEEAEWWDTHELSDELWDTLPAVPSDELPPMRPEGADIELLFTTEEFRRITALCEQRGTNPWNLLKRFILERLSEEEARDGPAASHV